MTFERVLIFAIALVALTSCVESDGCAGWRKIMVREATVDWLAENDPRALEEIIGHAEYGATRRCW